MCGIAAIVRSGRDETPERAMIERMVDVIHHRGPDDRGFETRGSAALGMCRLSIVDVDGGHQPIANEDESLHLVCNGEIYNQAELRARLIEKGHRFRTRSDVEVILHLYEEYGPECVDHLRGMFGFVLWDERRRRLFAARDRFGIKPFFYAHADGHFLAGSEIKSVLASRLPSREIDWGALRDYLTLGYIPSPRTIYTSVRKLPPAHRLLLEDGRVRIDRYWDLEFRTDRSSSEEELAERFLEIFRDSVRAHLMSDVPLGAFLSGGIDSSLVVALMSEVTDEPVNTFTIGFGGEKGGYLDERVYARAVSQLYGTNHTEFEVEPKVDRLLDIAADAFDEPFADDSVIPSYYICELTRRKVKVALTGLGGDELFAGYERYLGMALSERYGKIPRFLRERIIGPVVGALPEQKSGHYRVNHMKRFIRAEALPAARRYREFISVFNTDARAQLFTPDVRRRVDEEGGEDQAARHFDDARAERLLERALYSDIQTYLPGDILALSDRLSMHHSLELRVPFVDHEVMEFCATIPASLKIKGLRKKHLLRRVAAPFLPPEVLNHRKQGFASPMSAWLRTDLKAYVREALSPERLAVHGFFDVPYVEQLMDEHETRRENNDRQLFALLMFQKWHERSMQG